MIDLKVTGFHLYNRHNWAVLLLLFLSVVLIASIGGYLMFESGRLRNEAKDSYNEFYNPIIRSNQQPPVRASTLAQNSPATGPLRVNLDNPRYFTDGSGKAILLVGDHTWNTLQDGGYSSPPPVFDYDTYLDSLQANNINFFRFFVWEQTRCSEIVGCDWYIGPSPYQRPGPGIAYDGLPKFDLDNFDQAYFDRLRQRVIEASQRGIYVSIQLFEGFSVVYKGYGPSPTTPWPGHPFNVNNNINGIDGDPNGNNEGEETETQALPAITSLQEAYVKKVIDTVNDLDNVLFEICNESNGGEAETAWQNHMIDLIHAYEAGKPKQHPVGFTVEWPGGNNNDLFASNAEWISPNADGGYFDNPPPADGSKVVINDTDHLCFPCGDRIWMWKSVLRGYNPAFMDPYDCMGDASPSGCNPDDPGWVSLRKNLGYALDYANRMNLVSMTPHGELASSGYALANPVDNGAEYLVYLPTGGINTVDLSAASGSLTVEWLNPSDGTIIDGGTVPGGAIRSFTPPFNGDAVLYIYQALPPVTPTPTDTPTPTETQTPYQNTIYLPIIKD